MQKHVLIVLCNALDGRDKELSDWYDNVHLDEALAVPGFVSAQRLEASPTQFFKTPRQRYLIVYEMETDDLEQLKKSFFEHMAKIKGTQALDTSTVESFVFTARGNPKLKGGVLSWPPRARP